MIESVDTPDAIPPLSSLRAGPNFMTGTDGVIAVDKIANRVLFLSPSNYETVLALSGFATRVHEVAISPDRKMAYVPIYGDGKHGDNPNPGHLIAVFDLQARRHIGDISTRPLSRAARFAVGSGGSAILLMREQRRCARAGRAILGDFPCHRGRF